MAHRACAVLLLVLVFPSAAQAGIVTWRFSGLVETSVLGDVPTGTPVAFDVRIDPSATDACPQSGTAFFSFPGSDMQLGDSRYTSQWTAFEVDNPAGNCVAVTGASTLRLLFFDGDAFVAASIGFPFPGPSDRIPPPPSPGQSTYFFAGRNGGAFSSEITGTVRFDQVVSEASVVTLSAFATLAGLLRGRRG